MSRLALSWSSLRAPRIGMTGYGRCRSQARAICAGARWLARVDPCAAKQLPDTWRATLDDAIGMRSGNLASALVRQISRLLKLRAPNRVCIVSGMRVSTCRPRFIRFWQPSASKDMRIFFCLPIALWGMVVPLCLNGCASNRGTLESRIESKLNTPDSGHVQIGTATYNRLSRGYEEPWPFGPYSD